MKRSEMIEYIADELKDIVKNTQYSKETEDKFYPRQAANLLDMIEGFGMMPPARNGLVSVEETENGEFMIPLWVWEPENEKK